MSAITSRDNPRVRRWRALTRDARERRKQQRAMIEGENLIAAFLQSGRSVEDLVLSETGSNRSGFVALAKRTGKSPTVLADNVFRSIADTEAPSGIAAEISIPDPTFDSKTSTGCVFLEAIQDPGNLGAILRSAAAFGVIDAVLDRGCADAWSPKVLRAAAGAHFSMRIAESADLAVETARFGGKVICTLPRGGAAISAADLSGRIGWIFGSEGQGVSDALAARATLSLSIPISQYAESLNVAAAAAICFHHANLARARA